MSTKTLYAHPLSKGYWKTALAELKSLRMLVVTALMIALRVALKPLAIPLGPQLSIQTAMLATALGAMIFGPVVAIPAAIISCLFRWKQGKLQLKKVLPAIVAACIMAGVFSYISYHIELAVLKKLFGGLLLLTGLREIFYKPKNN